MFGADGSPRLERLVKGSIDGVGTRPRLRGEGAEGRSLIDRSFEGREIVDIPAATQAAAGWLRESQNLEPAAVGHRVVHGGPGYDRPMLIDDVVLAPDGLGTPAARCYACHRDQASSTVPSFVPAAPDSRSRRPDDHHSGAEQLKASPRLHTMLGPNVGHRQASGHRSALSAA